MARATVTFNCAMSLDGKIGLPDRRHLTFSSAEDRRRMSVLRASAEAIIVGGATLRAAPQALVEDRAAVPDAPPRQSPLWNVVLSRSLELPFEHPAFEDPRVRWLVVTGEGAAKEKAQARAEVVTLPEVTPARVVAALEARGVSRVLLEAGGDVAGQFFTAGCVDEIHLTVVPVILGAKGAPTPADGAAFPAGQWPRFQLVESAAKGGEVFLHYRRP